MKNGLRDYGGPGTWHLIVGKSTVRTFRVSKGIPKKRKSANLAGYKMSAQFFYRMVQSSFRLFTREIFLFITDNFSSSNHQYIWRKWNFARSKGTNKEEKHNGVTTFRKSEVNQCQFGLFSSSRSEPILELTLISTSIYGDDCKSHFLAEETFNHLPKKSTFRNSQNLTFKLALSETATAEGWSFQLEARLVWKTEKTSGTDGCPSEFFPLRGSLGKCVQVLSARNYLDGATACTAAGGQIFPLEYGQEAAELRRLLFNGHR